MIPEIHEQSMAHHPPATIEDFLAYIENRQERYEFINGAVNIKAGNTKSHAIIVDNVHEILKGIFKPRGCKSFQETIFLRLQDQNSILLPDVVVTADPDDFSPKSLFLDNPFIIAEVISPETDLLDRAGKWQQYRLIDSLMYYLLIRQDEPHVELYARPHGKALFYYDVIDGLDTAVNLMLMGANIPMEKIYDGINFEQVMHK